MIRLIDVQKTYDNGTRALKGVSMKIEDGEFVFLVGPSGSGKSTILKLITGEVTCSGGRLMVNGYNLNNIHPRQIPYMRRTLGVIFQDFRLIEKKTVEENLTFVMRVVGASPGRSGSGWPMSSSWWAWTTRGTGSPTSSPAANSSGWPSPGPW